MKHTLYILLFFIGQTFSESVDAQTKPDFRWGNAFYFSLNVGETVEFKNSTAKLLGQKNHFNEFEIDGDTVELKVSRRTLPTVRDGIRIFVADNKNVKAITDDKAVHGLLHKDVLICMSDNFTPFLDPNSFYFPVSYNDGFMWSVEENNTMFAYRGKKDDKFRSNEGIDFDLHDARGIEKHWIVAIENSTVAWVEFKNLKGSKMEACVLLKSNSQPGIYYVYDHLYSKNIAVKEGDKLVRGEPIGTIWGDENWGHLKFSVVKSDTLPGPASKYCNVINCFPQLYELYFKQVQPFSRNYTKGKISFGGSSRSNGSRKNVLAFEEYSGRGWVLGDWNCADRVEWVEIGRAGNARLWGKLFDKERAACENQNGYYDFEINVRSGVYRIRAKMGDLKLESWQKLEFENVRAGIYDLQPGEQKWTPERVVKVNDGKLTVRIFVDETNKKVAGISEIVFQRAY